MLKKRNDSYVSALNKTEGEKCELQKRFQQVGNFIN